MGKVRLPCRDGKASRASMGHLRATASGVSSSLAVWMSTRALAEPSRHRDAIAAGAIAHVVSLFQHAAVKDPRVPQAEGARTVVTTTAVADCSRSTTQLGSVAEAGGGASRRKRRSAPSGA